MQYADVKKAYEKAKIELREDYDDGRPDIYRVTPKGIGYVSEVEAESEDEARQKALDDILIADPALLGFEIEGAPKSEK